MINNDYTIIATFTLFQFKDVEETSQLPVAHYKLQIGHKPIPPMQNASGS